MLPCYILEVLVPLVFKSQSIIQTSDNLTFKTFNLYVIIPLSPLSQVRRGEQATDHGGAARLSRRPRDAFTGHHRPGLQGVGRRECGVGENWVCVKHCVNQYGLLGKVLPIDQVSELTHACFPRFDDYTLCVFCSQV